MTPERIKELRNKPGVDDVLLRECLPAIESLQFSLAASQAELEEAKKLNGEIPDLKDAAAYENSRFLDAHRKWGLALKLADKLAGDLEIEVKRVAASQAETAIAHQVIKNLPSNTELAEAQLQIQGLRGALEAFEHDKRFEAKDGCYDGCLACAIAPILSFPSDTAALEARVDFAVKKAVASERFHSESLQIELDKLKGGMG